MLKKYHRAITTQALREYFSPPALEFIIEANLGQDHWLRGQICHPEYHFDQNAFQESWNYIEHNRAIIYRTLKAGEALLAQKALGRLTHAVQDFYAHSNYVTHWLARFPLDQLPPPDKMDPFDKALLEDPDLRSGKVYWPFEPFSWIPGMRRFILFLPRDSHAWMNLDSPARGPGFAYAYAAAIKRTCYEFEMTVDGLPSRLLTDFCINQNAQTRAV
jgi:hypothetical protein